MTRTMEGEIGMVSPEFLRRRRSDMRCPMTTQNTESKGPDRLGFADAVATDIAPLLASRGFARSETTPFSVKFHSPNVGVEIFHDPYSFEIELVFARRAEPSSQLGLRDMLDAVLGLGHKETWFFQASTHDRVIACIQAIAQLLRRFGEAVLAGDPMAYQQMEQIARRRNKACTNQIVQRPIRMSAEDAWRNHDYAKVRDLYDSIEADLTPVEKKRLAYARSHSPRI